MSNRDAAHYLEQAKLAREYALSRPANDLKGFFAALRDEQEFLKLASRVVEA